MKVEELEAKVKTLESQVRTSQDIIKTLGNQVRALQDIEEIKKLQRAYGYYIEHMMADELIDCFADGLDVAVHFVGKGSYLGKEGVKRCFKPHPEDQSLGFNPGPNLELLHQTMQLSPIVNVAPDGKTAKGRWYGLGEMAIPTDKGVFYQRFMTIYENDYVKENGKWKIKILRLALMYSYHPTEGFVKQERLIRVADAENVSQVPEYDAIPDDVFDTEYPSGYIFPFHYKHLVSEKETSEGASNASLKSMKRIKP